jgi:cell division protein FtsN
LPELTSRPVRATDALLARERSHQAPQPVLATSRRRGLRRLISSGLVMLSLGLVVAANYQAALTLGNLPDQWRMSFFKPEPGPAKAVQSANLAQPVWTDTVVPDGTPEVQPEIGKPAAAVESKSEWNKASAEAVAPAKVAATPTKVAASVAAPAAAAGSTTVSGVTNRFYVVVGSFTTWNSVEKARKSLAAKGKPAKVLTPRRGNRLVRGSRYFRLTVADFGNQASAYQSLPALRKQFGKDIMVLNY